jgi:hypothetical protein
MFYIEPKLHQIPGIHAIHRHNKTSLEGRWSIITTDTMFQSVRTQVGEHLPDLVHQYCSESGHMMESTLPPVGLAFKQPIPDTESTGSFDTYLSACATIYSNISMDTFPDNPPDSLELIQQEWELPNHPAEDTSTDPQEDFFSPPSTEPRITLAQYQRLQDDNDALTATISELLHKVQMLTARLDHQESRLANPPVQTSESTHATPNMSLDSTLSQMSNVST